METNIENNKQSMIKSAISYGLILGVILVAYSVVQWSLNLMLSKYVAWGIYLVMILCLYFIGKKYRDDHHNGFISYGKVFGFCVLSLVFAAFILGFYNYFLYRFLDPGLINVILENSREKMLESSQELTEEQIELALSWTKKFMTPSLLFIGVVFNTVLFGTIFSLITSIFVQKKDKSLDDSLLQ